MAAQRKTRSNGTPITRADVADQISNVESTLAGKIDVLAMTMGERFDWLEKLHEERRSHQERRFTSLEGSVSDLEKDVRQGKVLAGAGGLLGGVMGWLSSKL
jgi:hypothetical protein